jgi:NMD protein affecting ribosome stability and mRNA decay
MNYFNLPPGCTDADIDGPAMPFCERCGCEHNDEKNNGLCPDCQPEETEETE